MHEALERDIRPAWAVRLGLPSYDSIAYVRACAWTVAAAGVALYCAGLVLHDPDRALRACARRIEGAAHGK